MNVTRTHPVFLLSCTLAIVGWLITLAGLCASRGVIQTIYWCTVVFEFGLLAFVCAVVFTNSLPIYYPTILSLIVLSVPYGIDEIQYHLMIGQPALSASASGFIVLMTAKFSWLFLFGIQPNLNEYYSFKDYQSCTSSNNQSYDTVVVPNPVVEVHKKKPHYNLPVPVQASYPRTMYSHEGQGIVPIYHSNPDVCHLMENGRHVADPRDPDELSFEKGEKLNIHEQEGNWWKAQKADGSLGMVPSNYNQNQNQKLIQELKLIVVLIYSTIL
ncbi:hypothetical protein PHYBLDRAFT_164216 [Phycomyces blakesleeanus NRRL 1555(-)]|uniref:SH3 domain-containing protein n=1 Tax=Phycomyces blakesleeanus (strain ATCC 8743b / DSM 1359 / FGSC 10004 / NBRC 33097 / NRRL 1555) TaxID=763407 RepID=A0A162XYH6_PHYB8|nr:hypothetical protein PHYBLDRAFT_164216 [Phycomyces blakesleeanus NRRL 1555(-)]OAD77305.1 hypothetical protein PHYBLDRAFT_164216 [Phycomyces blakesleeanus NRRL 1555(-)]|eukprot:XP_018295345.1 hypothetical protein PHYBLDRAFT_164216 [Phycomyces blakesleeanus NRRL 1555(-)]